MVTAHTNIVIRFSFSTVHYQCFLYIYLFEAACRDGMSPVCLAVSTCPGDGMSPVCLAVSTCPGDGMSPVCLAVSTCPGDSTESCVSSGVYLPRRQY